MNRGRCEAAVAAPELAKWEWGGTTNYKHIQCIILIIL